MDEQPITMTVAPTERLEQSLDRDPASLAFIALAHVRLKEGAAEEALTLCRSGLLHHPHHSTGHLLCGLAFAASGQEEEATREFQEVIHLDPGNRIAVLHLGEAYRKATEDKPGDQPPVRLDHNVEEEPDFEEEVAFFTFSMAEVYESQGFFEKAMAIYERVLTIQSDREDVRKRITRLRRKMGAA